MLLDLLIYSQHLVFHRVPLLWRLHRMHHTDLDLDVTSLFNHANIAPPLQADRLLRLVVVPPDMHRVHHSVIIRETDSNFGFNFPWWDRLFNTYRAQPAAGHTKMTLGLANYRDLKWLKLPWMLAVPFAQPYR